MFSHPNTANNLICTEPSPKTPTEKFFESKIAVSNISPSNNESTMTIGSSSGSVAGTSHNGCTPSPTPSEASSSGYESFLDDSSQPGNASGQLNAGNHIVQQQLMPAREVVYITEAPWDSQILQHPRTTKQMLDIEDHYVPWGVDEQVWRCDKYECNEKARRIVTEWMLEVCEALQCEEVIFSLSVNYLDRFLLAMPGLRTFQLQLVALVCLFLAAKMRQCETLDPKDLSYMSDNSVTVKEILSWEELVLGKLKWNMNSVLAIDYLDLILVKLPELCQANAVSGQHQQNQHSDSVYSSSPLCSSNILSQSFFTISFSSSAISSPCSAKRPFWKTSSSFNASSPPPSPSFSSQQKRFRVSEYSSSKKTSNQQSDTQSWSLSNSGSSLHDTVRRHASTLISFCSTELQFACVRPSVIAAACVASAVRGILQQSQCSYSIASTLAFFSAELQIDIDSKSIRYHMNQIERLIALRFPKFSNGSNSSEHQLANNTSAVDVKAKTSSKASVADVKNHYHASQNQHRIHPQEQQYHLYHPYRSSAPIHHHHHHHYSPIHSTNGHSPNASCIGGTAAAASAAAAAAAAASATTTATSMHSPSRFSPITFHHCNNVPTAQVISAKMLLLEQQRSPPNRAYHLRQQNQHIPEALPFFARCSSTQPSVGHNLHLHDSSNTSTFSSSSPSSSPSSGNESDIFKSKLINFSCLSSESVGSFSSISTNTAHLLSPSVEQFNDEDRENMAPGLAGENNSFDSLFSYEELPDQSDDEDID